MTNTFHIPFEHADQALVSRRGFLGLAGMGLVAASLVGCSSQVGSTTATNDAQQSRAETINKVANMTREEEEVAWKDEPAYGKTLKVGYNGGVCLGGLGLVHAKGFLDEENLACELVSTSSATDALGSGQVDITGDHIATLLVPATNGVKMTFTIGCNTGCKSLYVSTKHGITKTSDLANKTIGLPEGVGTSDHNIAMRFLLRDNVDINSITWKPAANDAVIQGLENGELQAATLADQFAQRFVQAGQIKHIRSLTYDDDFSKEVCCVLAFNSDFFTNNPVTVKKYTRAFKKASEWIDKNKEEALDIMYANNWASGDRTVALDLINYFSFDISQDQTKDTLSSIIDDYKSFNVITNPDDKDTLLSKIWSPMLSA